MAAKSYQGDKEVIKVPRFEQAGGFHTTADRSKTMANIQGKNTKPELLLRKALWASGIRFRTHVKNMPGKPDIVIQKYRLAILVDGSFWHGFQWEKKKLTIKSNAEYWIPKIERNIQRDRINQRLLEEAGYTVIRFWDHDIKSDLNKCLNQVWLYIVSAKDMPIPELS
ncbi:DNA mismatch endonuclease, patch repair protein [Pedobacter terrae]|uniref:DNA mismatch endonuclease, patch repair protein n=1 Tax=Pedobacter terrae TaxID=405671 RepID=A0A1G7XFH5_9SPHI|nr:very short patch repair endonuclease [Pedobacter terrae]SDG83005.1 DNA mismatch endonuclease, patch repair protein [Pedobacter terrae]